MKTFFCILLFLLCLPVFALGQQDSARQPNLAVSGELTISGPFLGGDVEYLFAKNRWSVRANFGLIGAGAGVSYHLKPRINSSFVSLQYSHFGGDDKYNLLGAVYVYRYKKWIQAGIGLGTLLADHGDQKRGDVIPMFSAGIYVPVSNQFVPKPKPPSSPTMPPNSDKPEEKKRPRQAVYFEAGGRGLIYSANYDRRFSTGNGGFGASIGACAVPMFLGASYIALPVSVYYLAGVEDKHLELGVGITGPFYAFGTATIGYRYQPAKGMLFRIGFTPMLYRTGYFQPWGGVSFGYAF